VEDLMVEVEASITVLVMKISLLRLKLIVDLILRI